MKALRDRSPHAVVGSAELSFPKYSSSWGIAKLDPASSRNLCSWPPLVRPRNLFSTNQLGFGGNLKANSDGSGLLRCHPVATTAGFLLFVFLRGGNKVIFFDDRGRRGSRLLGALRRGAG
jgi:hypothetical protein